MVAAEADFRALGADLTTVHAAVIAVGLPE
jgi:hypothetical protein